MKKQLERLIDLSRQLRQAVQKNQISESISLSGEIQTLAEQMLKTITRGEIENDKDRK